MTIDLTLVHCYSSVLQMMMALQMIHFGISLNGYLNYTKGTIIERKKLEFRIISNYLWEIFVNTIRCDNNIFILYYLFECKV